ncbi:rod shape-determining protein MreC [Candidatus Bandiella euplotis]|uniref:Cell shape-determining protein MreC n=1 Tax=Candidatus Bandiella euplotis TaxID=1664265 RepID=A0ABZ0UQ86_9RICK|nr:rod shape-determining protein MreC [Candidatus Bandiella woodruffii]WPX97308.1 Cell shape-determining protein MreC [Candidatus Bandiella woodruffii]
MVKDRYRTKKIDLLSSNTKLFKTVYGKLFLLIVFSITLVCLNVPSFKTFRDRAHDVSGATYSIVSYPIYWVKNNYDAVREYLTTLREGKEIYLENQKLKEDLLHLNLVKEENEELKRLLNFQNNFVFSKITGRVVLESNEDLYSQYLLNIGLKNGVQKGNAVISHNRLVGRVIDVSEKTSKIQLLTDKDSKVSISIVNTSYKGIATGTYSNNRLKILYLPSDAKLEVGQMVVTSGVKHSMPYGLYVGKIVKYDNEFYIEVSESFNKKFALASILRLQENFADARKK